MKELDMEVTSEFVAMAAQLMYIKSKMLLPVYEEAEQGEDPRAQLVEALLEYQRYKEAGGQLRPTDGIGPGSVHQTAGAFGARSPGIPLHNGSAGPGGAHHFRPVRKENAAAHRLVFRCGGPGTCAGERQDPADLHLLAHYRQVDLEQLLLESQSRSEVVSVFLAVLELSESRRLQIDGVAGGYILTLAGD